MNQYNYICSFHMVICIMFLITHTLYTWLSMLSVSHYIYIVYMIIYVMFLIIHTLYTWLSMLCFSLYIHCLHDYLCYLFLIMHTLYTWLSTFLITNCIRGIFFTCFLLCTYSMHCFLQSSSVNFRTLRVFVYLV